MSIETMSLVNIVGTNSFLDECILKLINFKMFHIEKIKETKNPLNFKVLNEQNPYTEPLNKIKNIFKILKIDLNFEFTFNGEIKIKNSENEFLNVCNELLLKFEEETNRINNKIKSLKENLNVINHMNNLDEPLKEILNSKFISIHFGKISKENYFKIENTKNENFYFSKQDEDQNNCWGFYVTPKLKETQTFEFFKNLGFLEYKIPDELKLNKDNAEEEINKKIEYLEIELKDINFEKEKLKAENSEVLQKLFIKFKVLNDAFNYRKFAVTNNKQFNICGFIPTREIKKFDEIFKKEKNIVYEILENEYAAEYSPPVKLKTSRLFKPFEMYISTYGTPQYGSINPSSLVGLVYSIIFGIMFGDLGQGLILLLGGIFAWKKMKNKLGLILTRCGFSSMIFGTLFDSIFGFEGLLENFWKNFGLGETLPFHLLKPSNSIPILVVSCLMGMALILISIGINIYLNLKSKNLGEAIFSHNGVSGFVCYGGITFAVLYLILYNKSIVSPVFILLIFVLPIILIFFNIPLSGLIEKNLKLKHEKREKFTISSAIFDMIDILLSYFTNTLSFLRIGGLALSHAALMLVVMKFAKMASSLNGVGTLSFVLIVVIGNAFVILLEGLIVSIQALRLVYYEIFSRFYKSNGKPFNPVKINFKN